MGNLESAVTVGLDLARVGGSAIRAASPTRRRCGAAMLARPRRPPRLAEGQPWMTPELATRLAVERSLARRDVPTALRLLEQLPRPLDRRRQPPVRARARGDRSVRGRARLRAVRRSTGSIRRRRRCTRPTPLRWLGRTEEAARLVTRARARTRSTTHGSSPECVTGDSPVMTKPASPAGCGRWSSSTPTTDTCPRASCSRCTGSSTSGTTPLESFRRSRASTGDGGDHLAPMTRLLLGSVPRRRSVNSTGRSSCSTA